jgi:uncharacterized membrane protein
LHFSFGTNQISICKVIQTLYSGFFLFLARLFSRSSVSIKAKPKENDMENETKSYSEEGMATALPPATGSSTINLGTSERIVSAFGGAALAVIGLKNLASTSGITMFLGGGYLLARGLSGYCAISNAIERRSENRNASAMEVKTTFTINKPRADVYAFWRQLENLPLFMQHLEKVTELDDKRSTWTAKIPGAEKLPSKLASVSWEAEIINDISGELIAWSSLPGSTVDNAGEVKFRDSADGKGTEISTCISYRLPAGDLGMMAAKLFNPAIERMMRDDLRNFKKLIETGDTFAATTRTERHASSDTEAAQEYSVSGIH